MFVTHIYVLAALYLLLLHRKQEYAFQVIVLAYDGGNRNIYERDKEGKKGDEG
jgi:hypothetical protein